MCTIMTRGSILFRYSYLIKISIVPAMPSNAASSATWKIPDQPLSITTRREQNQIRAALRTRLEPVYFLLPVAERTVRWKRLNEKRIGISNILL